MDDEKLKKQAAQGTAANLAAPTTEHKEPRRMLLAGERALKMPSIPKAQTG